MKLDVRIAPYRPPTSELAAVSTPAKTVEVTRDGGHLRVQADGRSFEADVIAVATATYSVLVGGKSYEVRIERAGNGLHVRAGGWEFVAEIADPRTWRGRRGGALEAEGRREVLAPMPGKVVRLLVKQGERVEAGQGLLVVEAMKMQNEIRSPKSGSVQRLLVSEGQAVNAGEALAVVA